MPAGSTTTTEPATTARAAHPGSRMRAVVQTRYGGADTLSIAPTDRPVVAPDEVLVRVRAAGLDRGTWHLVTGLPYAVRLAGYGLLAPKNPVPGLDVAGVVTEVGSQVTRFRPGDEVFGIARGSFAEFAAAREDKLARRPRGLSFAQAAAVPVSGLTALQGLTEVGRVEPGQRVAILGASGGVGTFAVQIAAALGSHVTGVCSAGKADLVRSLGAEHVLDYRTAALDDDDRRFDLILDTGGNTPLRRLRRALTPRGTLVIVGGESSGRWVGGADRQLRALALSPFVGQRLTAFIAREHHDGLAQLTELIEAGHLVPAVERTYPLERAADALRHLAAGQARGKLVLTP